MSGPRFRLRKPKTVDLDAPRAQHGVVRGGRPGVGIYHQGKMVAHGATESAAWEAFKVSRVSKDAWSVPFDHGQAPRPTRVGGRLQYATGGAVGKRMTGVVAGVAKPKRVQPGRVAARRTPGAGIITQDRSKPPIPASQVGKADGETSRGRKAYRSAVWDERFSPFTPEGRKGAAAYRRQGGVKRGLQGQAVGAAAGVGAGVGAVSARGAYRGVQAQRRGRGAAARMSQTGAARTGAKLYRRRYGILAGAGGALAGQLTGAQVVRGRVIRELEEKGAIKKRARTYDPEERRQRRQGARTAGLAAGGGALTQAGVRQAVRQTQGVRRAGESFRGLLDDGSEMRFASPRKKGQFAGSRAANQDEVRTIHMLSRSKNRPIILSSHAAGKIGGGLALLGAAGASSHHSRSRANRRWK